MSDTDPPNQPDEIMLDLLTKQFTEGLSPAEQRTLEGMDSGIASAWSRDLERAAAAIALAGTASHPEALPPALRARIEDQAQIFFADDKVAQLKPVREAVPAQPSVARRGSAAGWLAAAACLLLALFGWLRPMQPAIVPPAADTHATLPSASAPPVVEVPAAPTLAEERAALLARADAVKVNLAATKDPAAAGVTGDAVWDPITQRGFLHFVGLPPNDPRVLQYQLWIFDGGRDKRYPVDGGVFDVPANSSEVIIPIRAALPVRAAKAFAVTIEKPGGVVVSEQRHVVVLGAAS